MHSLDDPNRHAPEAASEDAWGDFQGTAASPGRAIVPKPRKIGGGRRIDPSKPSALEIGVEIGCSPLAPVGEEAPGQLEVCELSAEVLRLEGDVMLPRRPERALVFRPRPPRQKRDHATAGENRLWGQHTTTSLRWMWIGGGSVVATVCVALAVQPLLVKPTSAGGSTVVSRVLDEEIPAGVVAMNQVVSRRGEAESIFTRYASASVPDDFLPWVRDGERLSDLIRQRQKSITVPPGWQPPGDCVWDVFDANGSPSATLEGALPDHKRFSASFVLDQGKLLLDWKATTGYGTAPFSQLARGTGDAAEIRGWIKPDNYHTEAFPESEFVSYQMLPPENPNDAPVWCYVRRGSPEEVSLAGIFPNGEVLKHSDAPQKVTVSLQRGAPSSHPNQWLLVKLLHNHWIAP